MQRTMLWLAVAAALLCVPAALAQSVGDVPAAVQDAAAQAQSAAQSAQSADPAALVPSGAPDVTAQAEAQGQQIGVSPDGVQLPDATKGLPLPATPLLGTDDPAAASAADQAAADRSRPWVEDAAIVAHEAGKTATVVLVITALASSFEGLRLLLAKPLGGLARRGLAIPLLAPLFSRIQGDEVLDNATRLRIHEVVVQDPGISLRDIRDRAGVAWGTAVHHLRRLEEHGLIVSVRQGPNRRFFDVKAHGARGAKGVAALFQPTARRIATLVTERPGINQAGLCTELGLRNPAASKHLGHFEELGLVKSTPMGRSRLYHPTDALRSALQSMQPTVQLHPSATVRMHTPIAATA